MSKRTSHIILFGFCVLMMLARPYLAYQMCSKDAIKKDPQKAFTILQRLVKKKDDHYQHAEQAIIESRRQKAVLLIPFYLRKNFSALSFRTICLLHSFSNIRAHYILRDKLLLLSRFRI